MTHFLIGCALGALVAACVGAPFLLPWSLRVRYLVTAPMTDPLFGLGLSPSLDMRAVTLAASGNNQGDIDCAVEEIDGDRASSVKLVHAGCVPGAVAKLDAWTAQRTPLLMIMDHGHAHMYGPDGAVTDLSFTGEKIR